MTHMSKITFDEPLPDPNEGRVDRSSEAFGRRLGLIFEEATGPPSVSPPTFAQIYLQTFARTERAGFKRPVHTLTPVEHTADAFDANSTHTPTT